MLSESTRRSARRSRKREESLLAFLSRGRMTLQELSRAVGLDRGRALGVLYGDAEEFALDLGLVRLGLVREVLTPLGVQFELTLAGEREAGALARARREGRLV